MKQRIQSAPHRLLQLSTARHLLRENGIVALPGYFSGHQLGDMQNEFSHACRGRTADARGYLQLDGAGGERVLASMHAMSVAVSDPWLLAVASGYFGRVARVSYSRGYRIEPMHLAPHRAFQPHIDGHGREIKVMILLTDCAFDGQRMLYARGTHRTPWPLRTSRDTVFSEEEFARFAPHFPCAGPAGSVFIFDTNGIHSGTRNLGARRDVWVFNLTDANALYPWSRLSQTVVETLVSPMDRYAYRVGNDVRDNECPNGFDLDSPEWMEWRKTHSDALEATDTRLSIASETWIQQQLPTHTSNTLETTVRRLMSRERTSLAVDPFNAETDRLSSLEKIQELVDRDYHCDLDLPLHPERSEGDVARDIAIGAIRDSTSESLRRAVIALIRREIPAAEAERTKEWSFSTYRIPCMECVDSITESASHPYCKALATDMHDCIRRSESVRQLRASVLFALSVGQCCGMSDAVNQLARYWYLLAYNRYASAPSR